MVVASEGEGDVMLVDPAVVGGVDAEPTKTREVSFDPGVGRAGPDELGLIAAIKTRIVKIARAVTGGEVEVSQVGDEKVGEVLAGAGAFTLNLGRGARGVNELLLVLAGGENVIGEVFDDGSPGFSRASLDVEGFAPSLGIALDTAAVCQEIMKAVVPVLRRAVVEGQVPQILGWVKVRLGLDRAGGDDGELGVGIGDFEVVDKIAEEVAGGVEIGDGFDGELGGCRRLTLGVLGGEAELVDACTRGEAIAVDRGMSDLEAHRRS